jgi:hypothetical protein
VLSRVRDSPARTALCSLLAGVVHAALVLGVALGLGYDVGPAAYSPLGLVWRYGGLVVLAAVPVGLALRYGVVAPLVALVVTSGYVLGAELTPPGPTFVDVAELEPSVDEPTGLTVVENGLYAVRYVVNASVWTAGFVSLALVEYVARTDSRWLPPVSNPPRWLPVPSSPRRSAVAAAVAGAVHAVVMVGFARRGGVTMTGVPSWLFYLYGAVGMWLLGAVPTYLLVRRRLLLPATLFSAFVLLDVRAEFTASVDGPHALYFGGWFLPLAVVAAGGLVEYGVRLLVAAGDGG